MTRLHDALAEIAESAPRRDPLDLLDLVEPAARTGRRRRRLRMIATGGAAVAVAAAVVIAAGLPTLFSARPARPGPATGRGDDAPVQVKVPLPPPAELPEDGIPERGGATPAAMLVYKIHCDSDDIEDAESCAQWRLVATDGSQWRLGDALSNLPLGHGKVEYGDAFGPLALTPDGRRIAYHQSRKDRLVVRDLGTGKVEPLPVELPAKRFEREEARLTWSPDGRWLAVSFQVRDDELTSAGPAQLVDTRTGTVRALPMPGAVLGVNRAAQTVMYDAYVNVPGKGELLVTGHDGKVQRRVPVGEAEDLDKMTGDALLWMSPDGRTLAAMAGARLDTIDVASGKAGRTFTVPEMGKAFDRPAAAGWSGSSVLVVESDRDGTRVVAVDTGTGKTRRIGVLTAPTRELAVAGDVITRP